MGAGGDPPHVLLPEAWPWPRWNGAALDAHARMAEALQGLRLTGAEASVRVVDAADTADGVAVDTGRWVVAVDPAGVPPARLTALVAAMGMGGAARQDAERAVRSAHRIGLGLEQRGDGCRIKLYAEHGLPVPQSRLLPGQTPGCALMIESWKSPLRAGEPWTRTDYWRLSGWDLLQLRDWLRAGETAPKPGPAPVTKPTPGPLERALAMAVERRRGGGGVAGVAGVGGVIGVAGVAADADFRPTLVRVLDQDGGRHGMGLRLYGSGLRLEDSGAIWDGLRAGGDGWGRWVAHHPEAVKSELGWCHIGMDTNQRNYMICYLPLVISKLFSWVAGTTLSARA